MNSAVKNNGSTPGGTGVSEGAAAPDTDTTASKPAGGRIITLLYYAAAFLMPCILLFDLYNRNYVENLIIFGQVMVIAAILAAAGLLLFVLLRFASGSMEGALPVSTGFWVCFWLFHAVLYRAQRVFPVLTDIGLMAAMGACIILTVVLLRRFKDALYKIRPAFNMLAFCLVALFFLNLFPAISNQYTLSRARAEISSGDNDAPYQIKRDFVVDPGLPKPGIHWIHADGMMRIDTAEDFWDRNFNVYREQLAAKGFVVNENAVLDAGYTYSALTAMLSPLFYDTFFAALISEHAHELRIDRGPGMADGLAQVGLTYEDDIVPDFEVLNAFMAAGYSLDIRNMDEYMPGYGADGWQPYERFLNSDLPKLLSLTTPLSFPDRHRSDETGDDAGSGIEQGKISDDDLFSQSAGTGASGPPRFIWYGLHDAHMDNVWLFDPDMTDVDATAIHLYPFAYEHVMQQVLTLVDRITEADPDAVIVIQSDHGFHMVPTQGTMLNMGYDTDEILKLNYSVLSAVRIPLQFGGIDKPMNPLNISRELVNRFVGGNYELLP